jgi:hypothetical protein
MDKGRKKEENRSSAINCHIRVPGPVLALVPLPAAAPQLHHGWLDLGADGAERRAEGNKKKGTVKKRYLC